MPMTETCLLKCLKLLRNGDCPLTEQQIADRIEEDQVYVARALEKLGGRELVSKTGEYYSYRTTLANEEFSKRMLAVYEKIGKKCEMESLVIGVLSAAVREKHLLKENTLLRVLGEEGFGADEIGVLLQEQVDEGLVRRLRVALRKEKDESFPSPPVIPWHYTSRLIRMKEDEYEKVKERWGDEGFFVQEEDYLIADFPAVMAGPAADYLYRAMAHVAHKIEDESYQWWLGLRVGCRYFTLE
jgi:Mn-dependent DtxR family transcriptional regulator